jgi:hypothetical protein
MYISGNVKVQDRTTDQELLGLQVLSKVFVFLYGPFSQ